MDELDELDEHENDAIMDYHENGDYHSDDGGKWIIIIFVILNNKMQQLINLLFDMYTIFVVRIKLCLIFPHLHIYL